MKILTLILLMCMAGFAGIGLDALKDDIFNKPKVHEIRTCQDLQDINKDLDGVYILMNDIDGKDCK